MKRTPKIRETRFLGITWKWYKWPTGKGEWSTFLLLRKKESEKGTSYVGLNLNTLIVILIILSFTIPLILNTK